jgi:pimeloyl-ACP methyl ester carboxylesterase
MSGPPVLLIHGAGSSFEHNWRAPGWVDLLAEQGRDVVGVELPGHGAEAARGAPDRDAADLILERAAGHAAGRLQLKGVDHFAVPNSFGCVDAVLSFLGVG